MSFHVVHVIASINEYARKDWNIDAEINDTAKYYGALLPDSMNDLSIKFGDHMKIDGHVKQYSQEEGAAIINLNVKGEIGVGLLILSKTSTDYCMKFSKQMAFQKWRLPIPPAEIMSRPLFYYVLFNLHDEERRGLKWRRLTQKVMKRLHGLGVAFLRMQGCEV